MKYKIIWYYFLTILKKIWNLLVTTFFVYSHLKFLDKIYYFDIICRSQSILAVTYNIIFVDIFFKRLEFTPKMYFSTYCSKCEKSEKTVAVRLVKGIHVKGGKCRTKKEVEECNKKWWGGWVVMSMREIEFRVDLEWMITNS